MKTFANIDELTNTVSDLVNIKILKRLDTQRSFHLALTGGEAGGLVALKLVSRWNVEPDRFLGLHLWWGDERFLPSASKDRNATSVLEELKGNSPIHLHPVLASDSNVTLSVAARRYATDLAGIDMDLTLLGVGPDGHVASIFPNHVADETGDDVLAVIDAPKFPPLRVSFSMRKINASESVWLMASGASKRGAVAQILGNDLSIPATLVHGQVETLLFVDSDSMVNE
ncbi:MAG: 6-phosphogluconolactonase [Actinobacteria bacterium]|nr:6-phosphogluconolactonase [Actinomycetota bacterium]